MARPPFAALLSQPGRHALGNSLYIVVRGPASARFEYKFRDGTQVRSLWLGSAIGPAAISVTQAREARAKAWLERRGGVPRKARAKGAGKTFAEGLGEWLDANPNAWAAKGVKERRTLAETSLATLDVGKITQADVLAALANETPRQHAEKRGQLAAFFAHAKAQRWRTGDNPAVFDADTRRGFAKVPDSEHFPALLWADLPAAFAKLAKLDTEAARAVRYCLLTAARPGAVESATWSQIKGDNGTSSWEYTIRKGNKPFLQRVPLTKAAVDLLGEREDDDAPLFKLTSNAMLNAMQTVAPDVTLHGTSKSTFKMWCDDHKDPRFSDNNLSEAALAHYRGDAVHRSYSRGDLFDRRRELMDAWNSYATGR